MSEEKHLKAKAGAWVMHYTDDGGFKSVGSQTDWNFKASQPPGDNKFGAYFTTLTPDSYRFSARVKIPKDKQRFVFAFSGQPGLQPKEGGKGAYILWTTNDYLVTEESDRQEHKGASETLP